MHPSLLHVAAYAAIVGLVVAVVRIVIVIVGGVVWITIIVVVPSVRCIDPEAD
jgi:hypothetical protein